MRAEKNGETLSLTPEHEMDRLLLARFESNLLNHFPDVEEWTDDDGRVVAVKLSSIKDSDSEK